MVVQSKLQYVSFIPISMLNITEIENAECTQVCCDAADR